MQLARLHSTSMYVIEGIKRCIHIYISTLRFKCTEFYKLQGKALQVHLPEESSNDCLLSLNNHLVSLSLYQCTALHVAAREGRDYTVECLVKKGAEITITDNDGVSETIVVIIDLY